MSYFLYNPVEILNLLEEFSDDKFKVLFCDLENFNNCIYDHKPVGAVIRDAALKCILNHFGTKMKITVDAHHPLNRGKEHASSGIMIGHGSRSNRTSIPSYSYAYKEKDLGPNAQKILVD